MSAAPGPSAGAARRIATASRARPAASSTVAALVRAVVKSGRSASTACNIVSASPARPAVNASSAALKRSFNATRRLGSSAGRIGGGTGRTRRAGHVPEGAQPAFRLGVGGDGGRCGRPRGWPRPDARRSSVGDAPGVTRRRGCVALRGVARAIVELGLGQMDVLPAGGDHTGQRRPSARQVGVERFEVARSDRRAARIGQRQSVQTGGAGTPAMATSVGRRSAWPTGASMTPAPTPGPADDQRDGERGVVGEQPVRALAVVAEPLAVIGGDDDQRVIQHAAPDAADRATGRASRRYTPPRRCTG